MVKKETLFVKHVKEKIGSLIIEIIFTNRERSLIRISPTFEERSLSFSLLFWFDETWEKYLFDIKKKAIAIAKINKPSMAIERNH